MLRWTAYLVSVLIALNVLGLQAAATPPAQSADTAFVTFTAVTCPSGLPLDQVTPEVCTDPRDDIVIEYDKILVEVEHTTVTTDANGEAAITVPDPANGANFDIMQEDNQLYYAQSPGPYPGYGVYLADCGQAGLDAGFFYSGLGVAFDDLAVGDEIACQLFFIPPAATSSAQLLSGTCDALGEVVADLNPLTKPYGDVAGAAVPAPVEVSLSSFGLTLDELTVTDHTIIVYNEHRDGQPILSCGDIGGTIAPNGALAFALPAQGDSRYSGIGVITTCDYGGAEIAVYMAPDLDGSDRDVAGVTGAQETDQGSPAGVYAGTCDGATSDDLTAELSPVTATDGNLVGADTPGLVEQSLSSIDLSLDDLVASDYVVAVFDEDAPDTALVCGPIGGILGPVAHTFDDSMTMAVGLPALGDSLYSGVAVLTTADEGSTEVVIYLAPDLDGSGI